MNKTGKFCTKITAAPLEGALLVIDKEVANRGAIVIFQVYFQYFHGDLKEINARAQDRFERRDWKGALADGQDRIGLYREALNRAAQELISVVDAKVLTSEAFWNEMRKIFTDRVFDRYDSI